MKTFRLTIILFSLISFAFCSDIADEITAADGFVGVGARAAAMGGAHIALAQDYSALFYNPAMLSYVYKYEITGSMMFRFGNTDSRINNGGWIGTQYSCVKLSTVGAVFPAAATRGGLAFAIGFSRFQSFDKMVEYQGIRVDNVGVHATENTDGGIGALQMGIGVQTSKYTAFGVALDVINGAENYSWSARLSGFSDTLVEDSIIYDDVTNDYDGVSGRIGLAFFPVKYFTLGLRMDFPTVLTKKQEWHKATEVHFKGGSFDETDDIYKNDYRFTLPFKFGAGIAIRTAYVSLAADVVYADWKQISYSSPSWMLSQNRKIPHSYRATTTISAGAEVTIPIKYLPTRLRFGYKYDPVPYDVPKFPTERQSFSGGVAMLFGRSWLVELTAVSTNWQRQERTTLGNLLDHKIRMSDIYFGVSYRF